MTAGTKENIGKFIIPKINRRNLSGPGFFDDKSNRTT